MTFKFDNFAFSFSVWLLFKKVLVLICYFLIRIFLVVLVFFVVVEADVL